MVVTVVCMVVTVVVTVVSSCDCGVCGSDDGVWLWWWCVVVMVVCGCDDGVWL